MKRTIEMILMTLLIILAAVFTSSILTGCSSDDDVVEDIYVFLPNKIEYAYWAGDRYIKLEPEKNAPYTQTVFVFDEKGRQTIEEMIAAKDSPIIKVYRGSDGFGSENEYIVITNERFYSTDFYVSNSYRTIDTPENTYPIRFVPRIALLMKEGHQYEEIEDAVKKKAKDIGEMTVNNNYPLANMTVLDCQAMFDVQIMSLSSEINQMDNVVWAEPDYYGHCAPSQVYE